MDKISVRVDGVGLAQVLLNQRGEQLQLAFVFIRDNHHIAQGNLFRLSFRCRICPVLCHGGGHDALRQCRGDSLGLRSFHCGEELNWQTRLAD